MLKSKLADRERAVVCTAYRLRRTNATLIQTMSQQQIIGLFQTVCGEFGRDVLRHVGHSILAYDIKVSALTLRVRLNAARATKAFDVADVVDVAPVVENDHNAHLGAAEVCGG